MKIQNIVDSNEQRGYSTWSFNCLLGPCLGAVRAMRGKDCGTVDIYLFVGTQTRTYLSRMTVLEYNWLNEALKLVDAAMLFSTRYPDSFIEDVRAWTPVDGIDTTGSELN